MVKKGAPWVNLGSYRSNLGSSPLRRPVTALHGVGELDAFQQSCCGPLLEGDNPDARFKGCTAAEPVKLPRQ